MFFDIGFSELLIIAVVALLVLGPERLPKVARMLGLWVRKARAHWFAMKTELEHELLDEELKRNLHDGKRALQSGLEDLDSAVRLDGQTNDEQHTNGRQTHE